MSMSGHGGALGLQAEASPRVRERFGRYVLTEFDERTIPPTAEVVHLVEKAWGADYQDKAVFKFDAEQVAWLTPSGRFFGIWVATETGEPAGCELALEREVMVGGRLLRAYYVTLLSVAPEHRGAGVAQRILHHIAEIALVERRADVVLSSFDEGAAGKPTVQKHVGTGQGQLAIAVSKPLEVWAAPYDLLGLDRYERMTGPSRVALLNPLRSWLERRGRGQEGAVTRTPVEEAPAHASQGDTSWVACTFSSSVVDMYGKKARDAGAFEFSDGSGRFVAAHRILTLIRPGLPEQLLGQVQLIYRGNASNRLLARGLQSLNAYFASRGCLAGIIVANGMVPASVLIRAGFLPTPRKVHAALRGPKALIDTLPTADARWLVDLL